MKKVVIDVGIVRSTIKGDFPFSKTSIELSFRPEGYQFSPQYQRRIWDGRIRYLTKNNTFPSGLVPRLRTFLEGRGIDVRVNYLYTLPPTYAKRNISTQLDGMKPRRYQLEAVWNAVNRRQGVIKLPTGSGKTVIATLIVKTLNQRTLFLTHKLEILHQTYERFVKEFGKDKVGIRGDGITKTGTLICVAMVQTLVKMKDRAKWLKNFDVFIGDEIHHAGAKTWATTIKSCKAIYRIGLTATPFDGPRAMSLESCTGPVIYSARTQTLAKEGYLSLPEIVMARITKPTVSDRYDYHQAYTRGITENDFRNTRIVNFASGLAKRGYGPVLVFSTTLKHLGKLMVLATTQGLNFNVLSGADSTSERQAAIQNMKDGTLDILFVSTIFDEGVDIPNVGSVIMAAVGKSKNKLIQRLGRGMRVSKGKNSFLVVDFYDETCKYLLNHSKKRRTIYKKEGYPVFVGSLSEYMKGK